MQSCVSRAGVGRGGLGWNRLLHPSDWGFSMAIMRDLMPVCKISPFHHFLKAVFLNPLDLPWCLPTFQKRKPSPTPGIECGGRTPVIFRVDFPCGFSVSSSSLPQPRCPKPVWGCPSCHPSAGIEAKLEAFSDVLGRLEMRIRCLSPFKKIPTPFLCNFAEWRGLRSVCFEQR